MNSWVLWALWVPSVLLFILLPGCLSLRGPSSVNGTIGGSLTVRCTYQKEDAARDKFWCKSPCQSRDRVIVRTSTIKREVTKGRVTIRDDPENLTFTVTLERLRAADAGTYTCGISLFMFSFHLKVKVVVSIFPAPQTTSASPETSTEAALLTWSMNTQKESPDLYSSADPEPSSGGFLFSSIHLWILVFLKVPLMLGLIGTILWARWHRRAHAQLTPLCDGQ